MHDKQMNSSNKENYVGDIVIEDGKITKILNQEDQKHLELLVIS